MSKDKPKKKDKAAKRSDVPTPADAEIVLKLYELRREPVMRASRETLLRWFPESYEELAAVCRLLYAPSRRNTIATVAELALPARNCAWSE